MRIAPLLFITVVACGSPPRASTYEPRGVGGHVVGPLGAKGRLVVGWMTEAEAKEGIDLAVARRMIERWVVASDDVDFGVTPRVSYYVPNVPPSTVPFIVLDPGSDFWLTYLGGGHGLVGQGHAGGGEVELKANKPNPPLPCEGPRYRSIVVEDDVDGPTNPERRRFCAWLPKTFREDRTYPIVFLLPGLMSNEMVYLGPNGLGQKLDAMNGDAVLVGVDTSSRFGSSYLSDTDEEPYDTFLSTTALAAVEKAVHGRERRSSRAVIGQSTGGYNALSFGMRHSDLFSVIGASSPDPPNFEKWLFEPGTRTAKPWIHAWLRLENAVHGPGQFTSWAHEWSKDRWPLDLESGRAKEEVVAQWMAASPHAMLADRANVSRLRRDLSGRILVMVGKKDEFELFGPAESFASELNDAGIETSFVATEDGHGNGLARLEAALRFALERLD